MITAVDTNVLLDVFGADAVFGERSAAALRSCLREGRVVACAVVWAEVAAAFGRSEAAANALASLGVDFSPTSVTAAEQAGRAWSVSRERGGSRTRVVADFLIGAHAIVQAERLLTRDRGFYRSYFERLAIVDPAREM